MSENETEPEPVLSTETGEAADGKTENAETVETVETVEEDEATVASAAAPYRKPSVLMLMATLLVGLVLGALFFGGGRGDTESADVHDHAAAVAGEVWTCSMHPQIRLPEPGQCPICFMDLIPAAGDGGDEASTELVLTQAAKALAEVRTTPVRRGDADREVALVGRVTYDETLVQRVASAIPGRIEKLYVEVTGTRVKKGEHMLRIYSPELLAGQTEWLDALAQAAKMPPGSAAQSVLTKTAEGAYERLRLWGLSPGQLKRIKSRRVAQERITVFAPRGGVIVERNAIVGAYVKEGTPLYTVAELDRLWVELDAYERDLPQIRFGQVVSLETDAMPGRGWKGRVSFVSPIVNEKSRTVRVRVNFDNEDGALKPGMLIRAVLKASVDEHGHAVSEAGIDELYVCPMHPDVVKDRAGKCDICGMSLERADSLGLVNGAGSMRPLLIPASAPLITGKRAVVYVEVPGRDRPTYEGRRVTLGPRVGSEYVVLDGLTEGERVVVQGAFKLDAAMQVRARPSMMSAEGPSSTPSKSVTALSAGDMDHYKDVLQAYFALEAALTQSALADAKKAAGRLATVLKKARVTDEVASTDFAALATGAAAMRDSEVIGKVRALFAPFSATLVNIARRYGAPEGMVVQPFHCPMANDNQGALWIEPATQLSNPYFGDEMLRCGTAEPELSAASIAAPEAAIGFRPGLDNGVGAKAGAKARGVPASSSSEATRAGQTITIVKGLAKTVDAYLKIEAALTDDDFAAAKKAAGPFHMALAVWPKDTALLKSAAGLHGAKDISSMRKAFSTVSAQVTSAAKRNSTAVPKKLYAFFCPMANGGAGAVWLQATPKLSNPYFGAKMPDCGESRGSVGGAS